jgi:hypothetical protein
MRFRITVYVFNCRTKVSDYTIASRIDPIIDIDSDPNKYTTENFNTPPDPEFNTPMEAHYRQIYSGTKSYSELLEIDDTTDANTIVDKLNNFIIKRINDYIKKQYIAYNTDWSRYVELTKLIKISFPNDYEFITATDQINDIGYFKNIYDRIQALQPELTKAHNQCPKTDAKTGVMFYPYSKIGYKPRTNSLGSPLQIIDPPKFSFSYSPT